MSNDILSYNKHAKRLNDYTFSDYYYRLMLIAQSVFKWNNLPDAISERHIEKFLFTDGDCVYFNDKSKGFMVAKSLMTEGPNYYGDPISVRPILLNDDLDTDELKVDEECVLIRNNDESIPTARTIKLFALRLTDVTRTIDVNIHAQKTPILILCSEKQKVTMKNVYSQYSGNEPVIYGDKDIDLNEVKVLKTDAPIVFDKLQRQKQDIMNECLTFLGINNTNTEKRERLITDEVEANNQLLMVSASVMLKSRQEAANKINQMFGTDISVEMRSFEEIEDIIKNTSAEGKKDGDDE